MEVVMYEPKLTRAQQELVDAIHAGLIPLPDPKDLTRPAENYYPPTSLGK